MVSLKTSVVLLLVAVACVSAGTVPATDKTKYDVENSSAKSPEPIPTQGNFTTIPPLPTTTQNTTSTSTTVNPTTSTATPNGTSTTTTTQKPITTTTSKPSTSTTTTTTTTTTTPPVPTTSSPNVTTTVPPPPSPEPIPSRSWDGSSFLGGMVLAFGIVAVGFVGYRFFYLGRGGAYHTL